MEEKKSKPTVTVNVHLSQATKKELPDAMVYVFDANGQFLASKALPKEEKAQVVLSIPEALADESVRVLVGPPRAEDGEEEIPRWMAKLLQPDGGHKAKPALPDLTRRHAYEKHVRLSAGKGLLDLVISPVDWGYWLLCSCTVRGRLIKRIPLPDGTTKDLGVCHACVKIYEVDKIPKIILRLPDRDLFRLRDDIWRKFKEPLPRPPKIIPIPPDPPPFLVNDLIGPLPQGEMRNLVQPAASAATPVIPLPPPESQMELMSGSYSAGDVLLAEMEPIFMAGSAAELRQELLASVDLLATFICAFDWLWYWFHTDLIKCVCTDEEGRFETTIWYPCAGDEPDLYFKAVQCIGGSLHTLYDPGVACHTHWNYACGTEVTLITHDPAAITCAPQDPVIPPLGVTAWVMPYAVGGLRLDQIKPFWDESGGWHVHDPDPSLRGLTNYSDGSGTWVNAPFGGSLGFRHGYSSAFPINLPGKPFYYRWQYNKLTSTGAETEWRDFASPVAETVVRHYVDQDLAHLDLPPTFPAYTLGPKEVNSMHLYEFKPHAPPAKAGHQREWPVDDWFGDIYSGILTSVNLPGGAASAAGRYKVKLTVYDPNGNLITPAAGTFRFIVPVGLAADGVSVIAREADASEIDGSGFVFFLHIDNNACEADIYEASINSVAAGPCGFIAYAAGDDVHLSFKAKHPNGFGRFKFGVVKGSTGYVGAACAPDPIGVVWANAPLVTDTPVNDFSRNASSVYAKDVDESDIRGGCPKAAFGETLYVAATATNGWVRLSGLDASATPKAFALEPKTP